VATALGTAGWTVLLALAPGREARSACEPAVALEGAETLVSTIGEALAEHRVAPSASEGCPILRVRVGRQRKAIAIAIEDPYGRHIERRVSSVAAAGALIESWAVPFLTLELGPGPEEIVAPPPVATVPVVK